MVATAVPTPATPTAPGRVSDLRHGRHAAAARARRQLAADALRELREQTNDDPRRFRGMLPRWHDKNVHLEITDGQYAEIGHAFVWRYDPKTGRKMPVREGTKGRVTWGTRDKYLNCTLPAIVATARAQSVLAAHGVDPATFLRWAREESKYASDQLNGRRIIVRAVTIGLNLEISTRTVQRCRSAARQLGVYATVYPGRMLGELERAQCRMAGSHQRGLAAESAFVVPRDHAGLCPVSCLHRGVAHGQFSDNPELELTVQTDGRRERTSSALTKKRGRRKSPGWALARAVSERLSWARGADPRDLLRPLSRFATAKRPWTADDVVRHIDNVNARLGWSAIHSPADLKAPPGALLAFYLRDADADNDHPRLDVFLAQDRRAATRADQLRARELHDRGERCGRDWCC